MYREWQYGRPVKRWLDRSTTPWRTHVFADCTELKGTPHDRIERCESDCDYPMCDRCHDIQVKKDLEHKRQHP